MINSSTRTLNRISASSSNQCQVSAVHCLAVLWMMTYIQIIDIYLSGAVTVNENVEADGSIRLFSIFLYSTTKSDFYLL